MRPSFCARALSVLVPFQLAASLSGASLLSAEEVLHRAETAVSWTCRSATTTDVRYQFDLDGQRGQSESTIVRYVSGDEKLHIRQAIKSDVVDMTSGKKAAADHKGIHPVR
jgi:hypothetical protein